MSAKWFWVITVLFIFLSRSTLAHVQSKVRCSQDLMEVDIVRSSPQAKIYLQQLKNYPDEACRPVYNNGVATFKLSLAEQNMSRCGIARVVNKLTGQKVYYHRIIVEEPVDSSKHMFTIKCIVTEVVLQPRKISKLKNNNNNNSNNNNHTVARRSVLPAGFQEDDTIDIRGEIAGSAPIPMLSVGVRQGGNLVTGELNVSPGTPLQMEIFLNHESAPVYGLLATYMQVTDTKSAEETIIFNGCSVDPYLFENFNTVDGDFLSAKFRAFKFPESTYVQFRGTVNVCLDKCQGVECSNGQIGFGRKKRAISASADKNKVFEVTMSTFIRVDYDSDTVPDKDLAQFIRPGKNRTIARSITGEEEVQEQFILKWTETNSSSAAKKYSWTIISILIFNSIKYFL